MYDTSTIFDHAFLRTGKKLNKCCESAFVICGTSFRSGLCHRLEADQDEKILFSILDKNTSISDLQTTVEDFNAHKAFIPCRPRDSDQHFDYGSGPGITPRRMRIHSTEFNHSKYNYVIYYHVLTSTGVILDEELV